MPLHYEDATPPEIHKLVVGPMDNNVYVLRCKETGDAVLLDAANEHEKLLELCRTPRRPPGARDPWPLGPHPGRAGRPRRRLRGGRDRRRRGHAPLLRFRPRGRLGDPGRAACGSAPSLTPGHTPGSMCFRLEGSPVLFSGDTLFPGGPGNTTLPRRRLRRRSSAPSTIACSPPSRPTRSCCPGTAPTPPSAPSARTSRSGSTGAGSPRRTGAAAKNPV